MMTPISMRDGFVAAIVAIFAISPAMAQTCPTVPPTAVELTIPWSGTTYGGYAASGSERLLAGVPTVPDTDPALIVMFHGYLQDYCWETNDVVKTFRNDMFAEANQRGWYIVTFDGQGIMPPPPCSVPDPPLTYGGEFMHLRTEDVIAYMLTTYPDIDPERIYGFGVSMGGGDVVTYAARHQAFGDPGVFAAIWARSGTHNIEFVRPPDPPGGAGMGCFRAQIDASVEGISPTVDLFPYSRASGVEMDASHTYLPYESLIHNLSHLDMKLTVGLAEQDQFLLGFLALEDLAADQSVEYSSYFLDAEFDGLPGESNHNLDGVNVSEVFSFFSGAGAREFPLRATTLAADDQALSEPLGRGTWRVYRWMVAIWFKSAWTWGPS